MGWPSSPFPCPSALSASSEGPSPSIGGCSGGSRCTVDRRPASLVGHPASPSPHHRISSREIISADPIRLPRRDNIMSAPNQPAQRMLGDLPLIEASRFTALGYDYFRGQGFASDSVWNAGRNLEFLQRLLFDEQDKVGVDLDSAYQSRYRFLRRYTSQIPFHPDILPHWERYADAMASGDGAELFRIRDIFLPPAPFLANKLMPALASSNDTLTHLELVYCGLKSDGFACIADFLTDNASVATLDLSRNKIDSVDDAKFLALAIWNHPELRFVNLSKCGLGGTKGVLSEVLGGVGNLETLLLDRNGIAAEGIALIAEFLATNTTMTTLSLECNHIDDYFTRRLFTLEERNLLRVNENKVDNAAVIGKALKKNTSLRQLNLQRCNGMNLPTFLDSKRATELLTHLDLSWNKIGTEGVSEGVEIIADYLERNPVLEELNLATNWLKSPAAKLIANALKSNDTLQCLDLHNNRFTDKSVPFFAEMLRNNNTLLSLDLTCNTIKKKTGRKELLKSICNTSSLDAIVDDSNHSCQLILSVGKGEGTHETVLRNINALEDEAQKIRYKVVLSLFALDTELFSPRAFDSVYLELMPRLLYLVQQEIGYGGFGEGVVETTRKRRKNGFDPTLARLYEVVSGWHQVPLLFVRGPGVLKKKRKRKRHVMSFKEDEDEEWTPRSR